MKPLMRLFLRTDNEKKEQAAFFEDITAAAWVLVKAIMEYTRSGKIRIVDAVIGEEIQTVHLPEVDG